MPHFDLSASIIFGIGTLQGLLVSINLFFKKKGSGIAQFFLIGMLLCITLIIFQNFIILSGNYIKYPHLIMPFVPLNGLIGPLFYFYVLYLIKPDRKFRLYDILHASIFFYLLYSHIGFLGIKEEYKIKTAEYFYFSNVSLDLNAFPAIFFKRMVVIGYAITAIYLIRQRMNELKNWSSDTNLQYLSRFKLITYLFLAYAISSCLGQIYSYIFEVTIGRYEIYHHIINSLIVVTTAIIAMQQPERLSFHLKTTSKRVVSSPSSYKPATNHLKEFMIESKAYLNPHLKLYDLAKLIDTPPHILSEQINMELNVNFYEFVNQYRVEEFKSRVVDPAHKQLTFLAIAHDVGFNSKASFNRIFKKQTGMTPSQYKASVSIS